MDALLGYTGFVGGNLLAQRPFEALFNSKNFHELRNRQFDEVYCAAAPAVKWKANQQPEEDRKTILDIFDVLATIRAKRFVLISTIDVYPVLKGADENYEVHGVQNHAYGTNRLLLEDKVRQHFDDVFVVRLPGLFGRGLKKNIIYDLLHDNCLDQIQPESIFQYYSLDRLWADIQTQIAAGVRLLNLFTEPIKTQTILDRFFPGREGIGEKAKPPVEYDLCTCHADLFGCNSKYVESAEEVLQRLGRYLAEYRGEAVS
jgi:nucleoside-diphosphate-sugar epimerase